MLNVVKSLESSGAKVQRPKQQAIAQAEKKPLKVRFTVTKRSYPGGKIEEIIAEQIP